VHDDAWGREAAFVDRDLGDARGVQNAVADAE